MANNLFEKYGIKDVADVTFYRIEKKDETYESQRKIAVSSILKGATELRTVYPLTDDGLGDEEGFEAYVFTEAELIKGTNYDCDDSVKLRETITYTVEYTGNEEDVPSQADLTRSDILDIESAVIGVIIDPENFRQYTVEGLANDGYEVGNSTILSGPTLVKTEFVKSEEVEDEEDSLTVETVTTWKATFKVICDTTYTNSEEATTGMESGNTLDANKTPGTHEYTYEEQVLMLFAKRQNLISKTGVRYTFKDAATIFGDLVFNDEFAAAPNSTEKVVVVGLPKRMSAAAYDTDEVREAINSLTTTYNAKAYDINYIDYAELVVEDEMGYYNPAYLGRDYARKTDGTGKITFFTSGGYLAKFGDEADFAIANALMWGDEEHYSINDAIDALRQKKKILDAGVNNKLAGINTIFGGYKVQSGSPNPAAGTDDLIDGNNYTYSADGSALNVTSKYALDSVLAKLATIANTNESVIGADLKVNTDNGSEASNRAIYVKVDGLVDTAAGAYIYLLRNKNAKHLTSDKDGIFEFEDKNGNKLYYQDKVFIGTEYLALVIIGNKGVILVVNRHGTKNFSKVAWMVNENGFVTNSQAKTLVKNGLIHTVDTTVNDETFEATCTVGGIKIRKTNKTVNRYVPVLFLDTLKVSTLEQSAEQTSARGGRGNGQLIIWDYGKEITLTLQDALYSPASMSAMIGSYEGTDFTKGVKETKKIDRTEKCIAKRSFIVPAGNSNGTPSEGEMSPQAVYIDLSTMQPYQDGAPIAEGEIYLKWTRSVAYGDNSLGNTIEISAEKFPGTYKVVGDTFARNKTTGEDQRFQFVIPQAKMSSAQTITLEAEGDPTVFDMALTVLRPDDGVMVKLIQYDVVENEEENDGSTMVKDTENLNLLDDAEMYRVSADEVDDEAAIGATEY